MKRIAWWALVAIVATTSLGRAATAEPRVTRNVVYGMYSGLALLMDVHYPVSPNGIGVIFILGSGWRADLALDATPLKENTRGCNLRYPSRNGRLHGLCHQPPCSTPVSVFASS